MVADIGMVFQHFNLFSHLTVLDNCMLAPRWVRKMPKAEARDLAMAFLSRVRIAEHAHKYPSELVGRAAAARGNRPLALHEPQPDAV